MQARVGILIASRNHFFNCCAEPIPKRAELFHDNKLFRHEILKNQNLAWLAALPAGDLIVIVAGSESEKISLGVSFAESVIP